MSIKNPHEKPAGLHGYALAIAVTLAIFAVIGVVFYALIS